MTREDLRDLVEGESERRIKAMRDFEMAASNAEDPVRSPMMRACVVMFHAHLEGFVKNSSRTLLTFMEDEQIIPLRLSEKWMDRQRVDADALIDVTNFLGMNALFQTKKPYLNSMYKLRNKISHGEDIDEAVQIEFREVREMADTVSELIESFGGEVIRLVDESRPYN